MSKKALIVFLTSTIILSVASFAALWMLRPTSNSLATAVLESARSRQNKDRVEILTPLETDIHKLTEEEEMANKVSHYLISDQEFLDALSAKVDQKAIDSVDESVVAAFEREMDARDKEVEERAKAYSDSLFASAKSEITEAEPAIINQVDSQESERLGYAFEQSKAYIDSKDSELVAYIDSQISKYYSDSVAYTDSQLSASHDASLAYTDSQIASSEGSTKSYFDSAIAELRENCCKEELDQRLRAAIDAYYRENEDAIFQDHYDRLLALLDRYGADYILSVVEEAEREEGSTFTREINNTSTVERERIITTDNNSSSSYESSSVANSNTERSTETNNTSALSERSSDSTTNNSEVAATINESTATTENNTSTVSERSSDTATSETNNTSTVSESTTNESTSTTENNTSTVSETTSSTNTETNNSSSSATSRTSDSSSSSSFTGNKVGLPVFTDPIVTLDEDVLYEERGTRRNGEITKVNDWIIE